MRGIGKGQTICLLVVPEIQDRIKVQVALGQTQSQRDQAAAITGQNDQLQQFLRDVVSWLVINSMRVDGIQFNLLCEQSVANVWRKRCFGAICKDHRELDSDVCPVDLNQALQVFRERIDFEIENSVPVSVRYSEKISTHIQQHANVLKSSEELAETQAILALISEEEARSDDIKRKSKQQANLAAADCIDIAGVAAEQSFNREQVKIVL